MQIIPAVNNKPSIKDAEFIKLTLAKSDGTTEVYTFSSSYKTETLFGTEFKALSSFLSLSTQQRSLEATNFDLSFTITGIDQQNIYFVLSPDYKLKGSSVQMWRGFYDDNYNLASTVLRYTGVITNYSISENVETDSNTIDYAVTINCANFKTILQSRVSGRATNSKSWGQFYPNDTSMDRVEYLQDRTFDFGKKVEGASGGNSGSGGFGMGQRALEKYGGVEGLKNKMTSGDF